MQKSDAFSFKLIATDGAARAGEIATAHGIVCTPAFMPVGTQAAIKGVHHDEVRAAGAGIILANTYHLMLRPTAERVAALGGLHEFMHWPLPILTDSGGYQVMSLAPLRKVAEAGVTFRSHLDGAMVELTPERAVEVQNSARRRRRHAARRMRAASGRRRRYRTRHEAVAALGGALQAGLRKSAGRPRSIRHRAGRRRRAAARGERGHAG